MPYRYTPMAIAAIQITLLVGARPVIAQNTTNGTCAFNLESGKSSWVITGTYQSNTYMVLRASDIASFAGAAELEPTPQFACAGQVLYVQLMDPTTSNYTVWRIHFFGGVLPEALLRTGDAVRIISTPESRLFQRKVFMRAVQFIADTDRVAMIDESVINDGIPTSRVWALTESAAPREAFDFMGRVAIADACAGNGYDLRIMTNVGPKLSDIYTIANGHASRDQSSDTALLTLSCGGDSTAKSVTADRLPSSEFQAGSLIESFSRPPSVCHTLAPCHLGGRPEGMHRAAWH